MGNSGIPYTSAPVMFKVRVNITETDFLSYTYPYSPTVRLMIMVLFFPALLNCAPSVVVTAAHCVGPFGGKRFYKDFVFTLRFILKKGKNHGAATASSLLFQCFGRHDAGSELWEQ